MKDDLLARLTAYIKRIDDPKQDRCWLCNKSPDQIRHQYYEYMKNPSREFTEIDIDDLMIMTYKTMKPICAGCYFALKKNPVLIKEIFDKPVEEVW